MSTKRVCLLHDNTCIDVADCVCLNNLSSEKINRSRFPNAVTEVEAILYRANITDVDIAKIDLKKTFVCRGHYNRLYVKFDPKKTKQCYTCIPFFQKTKASKNNLFCIDRSRSQLILADYGLKYSYGEFICGNCSEHCKDIENTRKVKKILAIVAETRRARACPVDYREEQEENSEEKMNDNDTDFVPEDETTARQLLQELLARCGNRTRVHMMESYKEKQGQVRWNFLSTVRSITRSIVNILAPNDTDAVLQDVFHTTTDKEACRLDEKLISVMEGIAEAYGNADHWTTRREILSIVASNISYKLLQSFIPGLTEYRFTAARTHAVEFSRGASVEKTPTVVVRFEDYQVEHFIDFLASEHVCTDMPFGKNVLKLSNGVELFVPNVVRNSIPGRIIDQYYRFCSEHSLEFPPLGRTSLLSLVNSCKASTRKSLQGINYFAANAGEAFEQIVQVVKEFHMTPVDEKRLITNLKRGRQYLKSDYKVHIIKSSPVTDHCASCALSDPAEKDFHEGRHQHSQCCDECENLRSILDEIGGLITYSIADDQILQRTLAKYNSFYEDIDAWKCHLLRSVNQDLCRQELIENLSNDTVFIYLDWAMKWLPEKFREPQSDFFGKRGLSWHISVVIRTNRNANGIELSDDEDDSPTTESNTRRSRYSQTIFVHVFDECTQDSEAVIAILRDVLIRTKALDSSINNAFLRSDNAGCYHSAQTILSLPLLSTETKVTILRMDFCDPQGGKGPCDRYAAVIKANIRRHLNENHNITTAAEFVNGCYSNNGVSGVSAYESRLVKSTALARLSFDFPKITQLNNFAFESNSIRVHRAWKVGKGKVLPLKKQEPLLGTVECSIHSSHRPHWSSTVRPPSNRQEATTVPIEQSTTKKGKLFECVEEGCVKKFIYQGNAIRHLITGKHERHVERLSLKDMGMQMYASKLERIGDREMISILLENTANKSSSTSTPMVLPEGWALPKPRRKTRLTEKQINYLTQKFDEGIEKNMRWKPESVVAQMETLKVNNAFYFPVDEILKAGQIRSFFSRIKSSRQKKTNAKINECEEEDSEEFKDDQAVTERRKRYNLHDDVYPENTLSRTTSPKRRRPTPAIDPKRRSLRTSQKENE
jgi:hypothetical protein